jgi:hypothetical protein
VLLDLTVKVVSERVNDFEKVERVVGTTLSIGGLLMASGLGGAQRNRRDTPDMFRQNFRIDAMRLTRRWLEAS